MARFNIKEIETQTNRNPQNNSGGFFFLRDDKDVATVRFMYNSLDDLDGFTVHQIELNGKRRYVDCLRSYDEPTHNCPLCAQKFKILPKLFVILFDEDTQEVKIWERGRTFYSKLSSLAVRYKPLVSTLFEIERNGKKGDINTVYETYPLETDEITLEDLPQKPKLLGTLILDKTYEELEFFVQNGYFEEQIEEQEPVRRNVQENEQPVRRRNIPAHREQETVRRRRPVINQHDEDVF